MDDNTDALGCSMNDARERLRELTREGLLTSQQESVLDQVISISNMLDFGKKRVVHTLLRDILRERNRQEINEQIHLLRTYVGTIEACKDLVSALDFAFRIK